MRKRSFFRKQSFFRKRSFFSKVIIAISAIFVVNVSALDLMDVLDDIDRGQDYKTCLDLQYSREFCKFAREYAIMLYNAVGMEQKGYDQYLIDKYNARIMGRYVCYAYRNMASIDKKLLDEIYVGDIQNQRLESYFDALCY